MNGNENVITKPPGCARWFRRGPWEGGATALIAIGIFMLMQPFSLIVFSYSFATILGGALGISRSNLTHVGEITISPVGRVHAARCCAMPRVRPCTACAGQTGSSSSE